RNSSVFATLRTLISSPTFGLDRCLIFSAKVPEWGRCFSLGLGVLVPTVGRAAPPKAAPPKAAPVAARSCAWETTELLALLLYHFGVVLPELVGVGPR